MNEKLKDLEKIKKRIRMLTRFKHFIGGDML